MRIKTQIRDAATGAIVKDNPERSNLILDYGLTTFAGGNGFAGSAAHSFLRCAVGSGTQPTSINSGAVTMSSVGTALTTSGAFFTARMVGALVKMGATGSAGQEFYISSVTNSTSAVAATAPSPALAVEFFTVWFVQEAALQTPVLTTSTYQTNSGDCQTTVTGGVVTHKRTFIFPVQVGTYTVNEIGYDIGGGNLNGRIVLPSSDVVAPTNFYVVIMSLSVAYSPKTPTAVLNVGTNINTAGTASISFYDVYFVTSTGTVSSNPGNSPGIEVAGLSSAFRVFPKVSFSQPNPTVDAIANTPQPFTAANSIGFSGAPTQTNPSVGVARLTWGSASVTTAGETLSGWSVNDSNNHFPFTINFTAPVTAPTGTMQLSTTVLTFTFGRLLVN